MSGFGRLLKKLMDEKNVNQVELAKKTGISQSSLSDYLRGVYIPKQDKIHLIADALGVSPAVFFSEITPRLQGADIEIRVDSDKLSDDEVITLAAHRVGHEDDLTEEDIEKIRLAIKIALMQTMKKAKIK